MIEIYELAEKIYRESVFLKRQKSTSLTWKRNRERWRSGIAQMRKNVADMGDMLDYSYSDEYFELIDEMLDILGACETCLREKAYGYKGNCTNYMQAFHNMPRAFFSQENRMRISVWEARRYASFWLEHGGR